METYENNLLFLNVHFSSFFYIVCSCYKFIICPGKIVPSCMIELNPFISVLSFPKPLLMDGLHRYNNLKFTDLGAPDSDQLLT